MRPHHLANLIIALGAADPLTEAPRIVAQFRDLVPMDLPRWDVQPEGLPRARQMARGCAFGAASIALDRLRDAQDNLPKVERGEGLDRFWSGEGDPRCYRVLPGDTLSQALENLIDVLSVEVGSDPGVLRKAALHGLRDELSRVSFTVKLHSTKAAEVTYQEQGLIFRTLYLAKDHDITRTKVLRTTTFAFDILEASAMLLNDTKARAQSGNVRAAEAPPSTAPTIRNQPASKRSASLNKTQATLSHQEGTTTESRLADPSPLFSKDHHHERHPIAHCPAA